MSPTHKAASVFEWSRGAGKRKHTGMAKRYFLDVVSGRRAPPDGDGIMLSDPAAAKKYGTRLLAEHLLASAGERDQQLTMNVRDASVGVLFPLSMVMHLELGASRSDRVLCER